EARRARLAAYTSFGSRSRRCCACPTTASVAQTDSNAAIRNAYLQRQLCPIIQNSPMTDGISRGGKRVQPISRNHCNKQFSGSTPNPARRLQIARLFQLNLNNLTGCLSDICQVVRDRAEQRVDVLETASFHFVSSALPVRRTHLQTHCRN